jgi:hypothetical protein
MMKAEAKLAHFQNEQSTPLPGAEEGAVAQDQLKELFYNHPRVIEVKAKYERADEAYRTYSAKIRDKGDPSLVRHANARHDAQVQLNELWGQLRPTLLAQLRGNVAKGGAPGQPDPALKEAEVHLSALKAQEATLNDKLNTLNIRQKEEGSEAITLEFERLDLSRAEQYLGKIEDSLAQIKFDNRNPIARIHLEFPAKPSARSSSSNRLKLMAMAPVGVMVGLLGLLVLLELHASRVVDPEDIPGRIHVPVIGVVPQLPQIRSSRGEVFSSKDEFRNQRQLDQFVQSLDHLRVALCTGRNAWGRDQLGRQNHACRPVGRTLRERWPSYTLDRR